MATLKEISEKFENILLIDPLDPNGYKWTSKLGLPERWQSINDLILQYADKLKDLNTESIAYIMEQASIAGERETLRLLIECGVAIPDKVKLVWQETNPLSNTHPTQWGGWQHDDEGQRAKWDANFKCHILKQDYFSQSEKGSVKSFDEAIEKFMGEINTRLKEYFDYKKGINAREIEMKYEDKKFADMKFSDTGTSKHNKLTIFNFLPIIDEATSKKIEANYNQLGNSKEFVTFATNAVMENVGNLKNYQGKSDLELAALNRNEAVVKKLLETNIKSKEIAEVIEKFIHDPENQIREQFLMKIEPSSANKIVHQSPRLNVLQILVDGYVEKFAKENPSSANKGKEICLDLMKTITKENAKTQKEDANTQIDQLVNVQKLMPNKNQTPNEMNDEQPGAAYLPSKIDKTPSVNANSLEPRPHPSRIKPN